MKLVVAVAMIMAISAVVAVDNGLGLTPQMGWNSWNHYGCNVNETVIMEAAKALVTSGMRDIGYKYVNIDDCWAHERKDGVITADPKTFPNGIAYIADYVHSLGLLLGIYTDVGPFTCANRPGSFDHEEIDAKTYASWGVDYLKEDWCWTLGVTDAPKRYGMMSKALNSTGRPIFFSLCDWGKQDPWKFGPSVGNSWRTTSDINDTWEKFIYNLNLQVAITSYNAPGGWNDPDMLEVGNGGMTTIEYMSHFSMWSMINAPLIAGNDLSNMDQDTLNILTAVEVIAINQDPMGKAGQLVRSLNSGLQQIWARPLADGSSAAVLFNTDSITTSIELQWADVWVPSATTLVVRDLWARADLGNFTESFTAVAIPPHGCVFLKLSAQ
eukprot:gene16006-19044_t